MTKTHKKLFEVALPLDAINVASAREKSIGHGPPGALDVARGLDQPVRIRVGWARC
ncbi:MAG: hypothetical protein HW416_3586 [Chloroflexi bacterium]|nr:hypothetical protein [Chloroflexota bacterium]